MPSHPHAIIVADGDVDVPWLVAAVASPDADAEPGDHRERIVIAADGGASRALAAGVQPEVVVGDLDSLTADERSELEDLGIAFAVSPSDKDESDMELCLLHALDVGATRISIVGALGGGRPEHAIANLLLLADPRLDSVDAVIVDGASRIRRIGTPYGPGSLGVTGAPGDYVSLFPIGGPVQDVSTNGLRFPLRAETLPFGPSRGLSNELVDRRALVTTGRGSLLVVHSARTSDSIGGS